MVEPAGRAKASHRASGSGTTVVLAALVLLALPLTALVLVGLAVDDGLEDIEITPEPVVVEAQERSVLEEQQGRVEAVWADAPVIGAPAWSGIVVEVPVQAGDTVEPGTVVAVIDDVDRIAWHSHRPFYRALRRKSKGSDVAELQRLLSEFGHYSGEIDGDYGGGTEAAVKAWAKTLGIAEPDGVFDPGWVVWLTASSFDVAEVTMRAGQEAPAAGEDLLIGEIPLLSATALGSDGEPFAAEGDWVVVFSEGDRAAIGAEGTLALPAVAGMLDPGADEPEQVAIERAVPLDVVVVPASSIMTSAAGETCVWVQADDDYRAVPVSVEAAKTRTVNVDGVGAGDMVLANPGQVLDASACP